MHFNSLSDDDQTEVFSRLPVEALLGISNICRKWTVPLQQACRGVTRFSLLGNSRVSLLLGMMMMMIAINTKLIFLLQMYVSSSTRGPNRILQEAFQEYGIPTLPSFYHVNLRSGTFTEEMVHFFLATFPNIEHLELVQIAPDKNFDSCVQFIAGLSRTLKSLSIFHEKDHELVYWEDAAKPYSIGRHSRTWAKDHLDNLLTAPRRLLSNISQINYPKLNHVAVIDFTMYSKPTPLIDNPPNLSHLESLYYIQPYDQTLFTQTLAIQKPWKNLKNLALRSSVFILQNHLDRNCEYRAFQETLANLRRLTISGIFPTILTHLNVCTTNLVYLHIHDLSLTFIRLVPMLTDLKALHTLRIYFDGAVVTNNFTYSTVPKPAVAQLPSIEVLQLKNTEIIHQPLGAAAVLPAALPNLRTLILEQDSIGTRQLRNQCQHCQHVLHRVAQFCKNRFIRLLSRHKRGEARFNHLECVKINCINDQRHEQETEWYPEWREWFEVWSFSKEIWEMEQVHF